MPPPPLARAKRPAVTTPPPVVAVKERPPQRKPPPLPPSNAATLAALRKGEKKPAADPTQKEMQDKVGNGAVAAGLTRSPATDPKFGALKKDVKQKKRKVATSHPPPSKEATSAQDAAVPPKDDEVAQGKTANAEKMNEAKPKEFNKAAFVQAVEKAVADKSPKNLKEAEEFPDSDKPAEIKKDVQDRVGEGKTDSADQIATTTAAPPDTSAAETKQVVPMAADRPPGTPATPDPKQATPDKLPLSATDMSAGPAAVDQQMADAQVTEPQLKKSNEPTFNAALEDKKTLEAHSETAPDQLRKAEAAKLQATTAQAKRMGTTAMGAIGAQRVTTGQQVGAGKTNTKTTDEEKRAEVTGILQKVFDTMKTDVEGILTGLDKLVEDQFTRGEKEARDAFTAEHKQKIQEYKDRRYSGWRKILWVQDWLLGLPDEANQMIDEARQNYIRQMRRVIEGIATTIANELKRAKDRIAKGREELQTAVKKLPKDLQSIGKQAAADFADQFDELTQSVDDKGTELVDTLATKYTEAVKSVDAEVAAEKEKNEGAAAKAAKAVKGVIETIKELKRLLLGVLAKAAQAVMGILKDPIGFLGGLITGVGGGLTLFGKNARRHLEGGVIAWLLGTGVTGGLQLPTSFDILGILLMLAALLGLSAANLRTRLARKVPPKAMTAAETGADAIPMVVEVRKRGVAGMWSDLKGRVGDLKKELISGLVSYLLPTILIAGITWIVSLFNPASAFIRACKMIIDIIRFIVTQGRQIIEFINAVLDAVIAISKGGAGGVPPLIERALAKSIPVLIGALAAILGIGGIAGKVKGIFQKLARPVNRAIDWVIDKLAGLIKKLWAKIKSKFDKKKPKKPLLPKRPDRDKPRRPKPTRPKKREDAKPRRPSPDKKDKKKAEEPKKERPPRPTINVSFSMAGEAHIVKMKPSGDDLQVTVASVELPLTTTFGRAYNAIDLFRHYMESIEEPTVKEKYKTEIEPLLTQFQAPTIEKFKSIYFDFHPKGEAPQPLSPTVKRQAAAKVRSVVQKTEKLLEELKQWADKAEIRGFTEADFQTITRKGYAIWQESFLETQRRIKAILSDFKYRDKPLDYRGSLRNKLRSEPKGKVLFDVRDFDVDIFVVHKAEFDRIRRERPTVVQGDKIFPQDVSTELGNLERAVQRRLAGEFPNVARIRESTIVLRREPKLD